LDLHHINWVECFVSLISYAATLMAIQEPTNIRPYPPHGLPDRQQHDCSKQGCQDEQLTNRFLDCPRSGKYRFWLRCQSAIAVDSEYINTLVNKLLMITLSHQEALDKWVIKRQTLLTHKLFDYTHLVPQSPKHLMSKAAIAAL
jgi:hypothetical protein